MWKKKSNSHLILEAVCKDSFGELVARFLITVARCLDYQYCLLRNKWISPGVEMKRILLSGVSPHLLCYGESTMQYNHCKGKQLTTPSQTRVSALPKLLVFNMSVSPLSTSIAHISKYDRGHPVHSRLVLPNGSVWCACHLHWPH